MPRNLRPVFGMLASLLLATLGHRSRTRHPLAAGHRIGQGRWPAQSGRLVLVHVVADGCGPCRALETNVFNQPGVAGAIEQQFVPVKLNANEYPAIAQGFGITRVPTDVIITPDGQILGKMISPATPAAYVAETTQVANQYASQSGPAVSSGRRERAESGRAQFGLCEPAIGAAVDADAACRTVAATAARHPR